MVVDHGGLFKMNKIKSWLPDKLFGKDTGILSVWFLPVVGMAMLILVFVGVVLPRFSEVKNLFSQIDKVSKDVKLLNQKRTYLLSLDQAELKSKSDLVENGVLSEKNSYLLIKIVSKVVSDFGYTVADFSVTLGDIKEIDKKSVKFDYQKVPVEVVVTGPKANFLEMVSGMEKSLPVLSIDNFNMVSAGEVATIKMSISAYYLPDWTQAKLEGLSITDLTPSKDESEILSQISSYKYYGTSGGEIGGEGQKFVPNNRIDPFY